ncbi:MAG: radical SAM protein [Nitrospinota bacterium]|nr:radical SAM protein [Nitrospinota bacterium]
MKILLIYPPDRAFPAVPYSSLPALAPCLKQAGHDVILRDASLDVFYSLMQEEKLLHYFQVYTERLQTLEGKNALNSEEAEEYKSLSKILSIPRQALERVTPSIRIMQSDDFYIPERFTRAWDDLRSAMRFYYGPNPIGSPNFPDLVDQLFKALKPRTIDPIADIYDNGYIDQLLQEKPDMIGISIPFIVSYFEAMRLAKQIRVRAPHIPLVIGGSLIDTYKEEMATDPRLYQLFDYAMVGEGEEAICKLAAALENGGGLDQVPNLYYQSANGTVKHNEKQSVEDLNMLPPPDFTGLPLEKYLSPEPIASFQTSRGCYYGKCTFCSLSFRDNFRLRDPHLVVKDMIDIHSRTGIKMFLLWDSLSPPKTLRAVAQEIKEKDLGFHWFAETKFEKTYLNREFLQNLGEGGCRFLQFGMESASERILDLIDKGNKNAEIDIMLDNMAAAGIGTSLTWFIGFPTETEEEADYSYDFIDTRRNKVTLSAYTGTYNLLPDQPLFYDQDHYQIKIHRNADGGYYFTYQDGSSPYDRTERDHAFLARGDAELLKHGAYILYSTYHQERIHRLSGVYRMGPLARDVANLREAEVQRTPETHTTAFARDTIKDFSAPPSPIKLVYQSMTGEVFRLLGKEMKVLQTATEPIPVSELRQTLGMGWPELEKIINTLTNRGLLKFLVKNDNLQPAASERIEALAESI